MSKISKYYTPFGWRLSKALILVAATLALVNWWWHFYEMRYFISLTFYTCTYILMRAFENYNHKAYLRDLEKEKQDGSGSS